MRAVNDLSHGTQSFNARSRFSGETELLRRKSTKAMKGSSEVVEGGGGSKKQRCRNVLWKSRSWFCMMLRRSWMSLRSDASVILSPRRCPKSKKRQDQMSPRKTEERREGMCTFRINRWYSSSNIFIVSDSTDSACFIPSLRQDAIVEVSTFSAHPGSGD